MNRPLTLSLAALSVLSAGVALCAAPAKPAAKPTAKPAKPAAKPAAKPTTTGKEMTVSFQTSATPPHDVTARPKGALDSSGNGQVFTLIDLNGGGLADGDKVQIELDPGGKGRPSYWQETPDKKINRVGGHPNKNCTFTVKWKQKDKTLTLQTASGRYVSAPADGSAIVTTAKATDPTALFTLVKKK